MKLNKIKTLTSYWKEVIFISVFCMSFFIIAEIYSPDYDNPFYPDKLTTGAEVMTERWPHPVDHNDPNFLADWRKYMGSDFHNPNHALELAGPNESTKNRLSSKNLIFWPWRH